MGVPFSRKGIGKRRNDSGNALARDGVGGGQLILGSVATLLGVGTLWLLKWVDFVVPRGHRATLVMVGDHNWTLMAELPKLLAKLHCRTRFRNRTQSLESG